MSMSERLQVLIDRDQRARLDEEAARRGTSVATLVREAIDRSFPARSLSPSEAAGRLLAAEPMDAPALSDLLAELDTLRGGQASQAR